MASTALGILDFAPWLLDVWNAREVSVIFRRRCCRSLRGMPV